MQDSYISLLRKIKGVRKPSPLLPSPYFFSALKGKKSTGSSYLVSSFDEIFVNHDKRKLIKKYLITNIPTKNDIRRLATHPIFNSLSKCIPPFSDILWKAKSLHGCSDELLMLAGLILGSSYELDDDERQALNKFKKVLQELSSMEKAFFRYGKKDKIEGASFIMDYHLFPKSFDSNYYDWNDLEYNESNIKELLSFVEIIKIQNLYAYFYACQGMGLSACEFLKASVPGDYTNKYWDDLLSDSKYKNWTKVLEAYEERYDCSLDPSDLRQLRRGKHLTTKFDRITHLLEPAGALKDAYHIAYCLDCHFRQLSQPLKEAVSEVTMKERIDTAQRRWNKLGLLIGTKSPLPTE